jgi:hypothetical protein
MRHDANNAKINTAVPSDNKKKTFQLYPEEMLLRTETEPIEMQDCQIVAVQDFDSAGNVNVCCLDIARVTIGEKVFAVETSLQEGTAKSSEVPDDVNTKHVQVEEFQSSLNGWQLHFVTNCHQLELDLGILHKGSKVKCVLSIDDVDYDGQVRKEWEFADELREWVNKNLHPGTKLHFFFGSER